ncbi:hypothetical protein EXN66_Car022379 [Channa argus]|uniref:Uncharacterized protein n=1 Tax=Channa argus TaxID=215402 RepID=A0A6G1QW17_CHAAH|nr:hypothetical protein EXN66_Car022379 [Channa argus]
MCISGLACNVNARSWQEGRKRRDENNQPLSSSPVMSLHFYVTLQRAMIYRREMELASYTQLNSESIAAEPSADMVC